MADYKRLAELGMVPPLARQLATQIEGTDDSHATFVALGMVPPLAVRLAGMIGNGAGNVRTLCELGLPAVLAQEITDQIEAAQPEPEV